MPNSSSASVTLDRYSVSAAWSLSQARTAARTHRLRLYEGMIAREAAWLEGVHGDLDPALALFNDTIASQFAAGNVANLAATIGTLAVLFDRLDRAEAAATIYGTTTHQISPPVVIGLPTVLHHLRVTLGDAAFEDCVATGAAMNHSEAVRYVRAQIETARGQLPAPT